jgi:hypothetical protein
MFDSLIHADWSTNDRKKWMTLADRAPRGWQVRAPRRLRSSSEIIDDWLFSGRRLLAGFDFPIGLPVAFGRRTGFGNFQDALMEFGSGEWAQFFEVADRPEDISLGRPFYPHTSRKGRKQNDLTVALKVKNIEELMRECEHRTADRPPACSIFWTLGGKQVGKSAIDGWQSVIRPALRRGARLWPFSGRLTELSTNLAGCVLCETYPREAYVHVSGIPLGGSKRIQKDRRRVAVHILDRAEKRGVTFTPEAREAVLTGFGPTKSGEDPFDSFVGLLGMIEVVEGRRDEGTASTDAIGWEGWILGQRPS